MDSPPSKKARGDTSLKAFNKSDKGEIEKPNPETSWYNVYISRLLNNTSSTDLIQRFE